MSRIVEIRHQFRDIVPDELEEGTLYISMKYATAIHLCFCGCGSKVVTLLRTNRWQLSFDGKSVSLTPSIGNWGFPCKSHYWIRKNRVEWAGAWSQEKIEGARRFEHNEIAHSLLSGQMQESPQQTLKQDGKQASVRRRIQRKFCKHKH